MLRATYGDVVIVADRALALESEPTLRRQTEDHAGVVARPAIGDQRS